MKITQNLKQLLLSGIIVLTLASCGGGGGGGGGGGDASAGNNATSGSGDSTQGSANNAPDSLNPGMEFSFTTTVDGQTYQFSLTIISSTQCDDGSYTYTPTGANTGKLTVTVSDGNDSWIEVYNLTFTDSTSGSFNWSSEGETARGSFSLSGRSQQAGESGNSGSNAGNTNTPLDPGYAPVSLQAGQQLSIVAGTSQGITLGRVFNITSPTTATLSGKVGTVEYKVKATNRAEFIFNANGQTFAYTLDFTSSTEGSARKDGTGSPTPFTLKQNNAAPPASDNNNNNNNNNTSNGGNTSSDASDSNQNNNANNGDAVYGWAPESISSKVLELKKPTSHVGRLGFDISSVVLSPVGATSQYSYKRLGDGKAKVTITSSSSSYAGTLELQFTSETEVQVKGTIGGNSVECSATLAPGSISSDEFICPEGGWAPESVVGKVAIFLSGNPMEFDAGGSGSYSGGGSGTLKYTYEKTGDNTAVLSGWHWQLMTGHDFSYTIKFTSPTDFIWSGWSKFDDRYAPIYGSSKSYYTNEEGTYKP